uniref:Uncharacterized protein n=1 Tax=Arundo donax TaxID=35708 RepID=A0A0A9G698_ARUDO
MQPCHSRHGHRRRQARDQAVPIQHPCAGGPQDRRWPRDQGGGAPDPGAPVPAPRRRARRAAARYVTQCSGEGIYFAAKSGRLCGQAMAEEWARTGTVMEAGLRQGYLWRWDDDFLLMFRFLDLLQRVFYGDLRLLWRTVATMVRCGVLGREVERLRRLQLQA